MFFRDLDTISFILFGLSQGHPILSLALDFIHWITPNLVKTCAEATGKIQVKPNEFQSRVLTVSCS